MKLHKRTMHWLHFYGDMQPKRVGGITHEKVLIDATIIVALACFPVYRNDTLALFDCARILTASRIWQDLAMVIDGLRSECNAGDATVRAIEFVAQDLPLDIIEPESADLELAWHKHQVGPLTAAYICIAVSARAPAASFSPHLRTAARRVGAAHFQPAAIAYRKSFMKAHERLRTTRTVRGPLP